MHLGLVRTGFCTVGSEATFIARSSRRSSAARCWIWSKMVGRSPEPHHSAGLKSEGRPSRSAWSMSNIHPIRSSVARRSSVVRLSSQPRTCAPHASSPPSRPPLLRARRRPQLHRARLCGQAREPFCHRGNARGFLELQSSRNRNLDRTRGTNRGSPCPTATRRARHRTYRRSHSGWDVLTWTGARTHIVPSGAHLPTCGQGVIVRPHWFAMTLNLEKIAPTPPKPTHECVPAAPKP